MPAGADVQRCGAPECNKGPSHRRRALVRIGGAKRDRTADLYNAIVALSQLSYGPNLRLGAPPGRARSCSGVNLETRHAGFKEKLGRRSLALLPLLALVD